MADILIRGMEMPDGCYNCGFSYFDKGETNGGELCTVLMCSIINQGTNGADYDGNRPSWCPLVPLPEGHGRLIDADDLLEKVNSDDTLNLYTVMIADLIREKVSTIIEAEGGGE